MTSIHSRPPRSRTLESEPRVDTKVAPHSAPPVQPPTSPSEPSAFARVLVSMGKQLERGEQLNEAVKQAQGRDLGAAELLALQSGVYRYSQTVDLASKLVDGAAHNVKTVIQGGGQ